MQEFGLQLIGAKDDGSSIGCAEHVLVGEGGSGSKTNLHLHFICDTDFLVLVYAGSIVV